MKFDFVPDSIILDDGMWEEWIESEQYKNWQREISQSFIWDEIVSHLHKIHIVNKGNSEMMSDLERQPE